VDIAGGVGPERSEKPKGMKKSGKMNQMRMELMGFFLMNLL